jgi:heat shock protein HtpX
MMQSFGLRTHIWNTGLRSLLLLAGFPVLLVLIAWAVTLLLAASADESVTEGLRLSIQMLPAAIPVALVIAAIWFAIAWLANQRIVDVLAGARRVDRAEEPVLFDTMEELAISRGLATPRLAVIESPARNAFASGLSREKGAVTVTRGLLESLDRRELRAVLAHELTHIRNGDARLGVVAAVFAGIISLVAEIIWRGVGRGVIGGRSRSRSSSKDKGGGAGALVLVALAVAALAWLLAIALRMALSRNREYLADAGAVELTQDPDAMISALRKVSGHSEIEGLNGQLRALLLHDGANSLGPAWFATHPALEERIEALVRFGGGHDAGPPQIAAAETQAPTESPWLTKRMP